MAFVVCQCTWPSPAIPEDPSLHSQHGVGPPLATGCFLGAWPLSDFANGSACGWVVARGTLAETLGCGPGQREGEDSRAHAASSPVPLLSPGGILLLPPEVASARTVGSARARWSVRADAALMRVHGHTAGHGSPRRNAKSGGLVRHGVCCHTHNGSAGHCARRASREYFEVDCWRATSSDIGQVSTRRARGEEPRNAVEHQEEVKRFGRAVLLAGAPLPDAEDSRYRSRIYRGMAITV